MSGSGTDTEHKGEQGGVVRQRARPGDLLSQDPPHLSPVERGRDTKLRQFTESGLSLASLWAEWGGESRRWLEVKVHGVA